MKINFALIPVIYRTIIFLFLSLLFIPAAWADYSPGAPSAPSSPTSSTGRRGGCDQSSTTELTVLAPQTHVGQTISSHPTLAWFVPEALPTPLEVFIYDITDTEQRQLIYKAELISTAGIMSLTLPDDQPGLEPGRRYFWQVVLLCNPNRPSSAIISSAELDVIPNPTDLDDRLHHLNTVVYDDLSTFYQARSRLYADAGLWYDAIADALDPSITDSSVIITLLDELADYEAAQGSPNVFLHAVITSLHNQN